MTCYNGTLTGDISGHVVSRIAASNGCRATMTFDVAAAARVPGMELLS